MNKHNQHICGKYHHKFSRKFWIDWLKFTRIRNMRICMHYKWFEYRVINHNNKKSNKAIESIFVGIVIYYLNPINSNLDTKKREKWLVPSPKWGDPGRFCLSRDRLHLNRQTGRRLIRPSRPYSSAIMRENQRPAVPENLRHTYQQNHRERLLASKRNWRGTERVLLESAP